MVNNLMVRRRQMMDCISDALPTGYKNLKYIETDGSQYLIGSVSGLTDEAHIYIKLIITDAANNKGFFGILNNGTNRCFYAGGGFGTALYMVVYADTLFRGIYNTLLNGQHIFERTSDGATYIDGVATNLIGNRPSGLVAWTSATRYILGKTGTTSTIMPAKHQSLIIDDKVNLVPAMRISDGEVGMYDKAQGVFLTNSGSGTFGYETLNGTYVAPT